MNKNYINAIAENTFLDIDIVSVAIYGNCTILPHKILAQLTHSKVTNILRNKIIFIVIDYLWIYKRYQSILQGQQKEYSLYKLPDPRVALTII